MISRDKEPVVVDASIQSAILVGAGLVTAFTDYAPTPTQLGALLAAGAFINVVWARFTRKSTTPAK